jgi:hypothetical protein
VFLGCEIVFCVLAGSQATSTSRRETQDEMFSTVQTRTLVTNGSSHILRLNAIDMSDFIKTDIQSVPGVMFVDVDRKGNFMRVNIGMRDLEYETCKRIYTKELDFYSEFPSYDFDFIVTSA